MYEIDFSPPPNKENDNKANTSIGDKFSKILKTKDTKSNINQTIKTNNKVIRAKTILGGLLFSAIIFYIGVSIFIPSNNEHVDRIYSDVEFMQNETLSLNYVLNFESETAKSIYTIEYQEFAISNLKKIVSFSENDAETTKEVLSTEINNVQSKILETQLDNKALLVSAKSVSTIQKFPIIVNYALHYHNNKVYKIQAFLHTSDDFMTIEKLKNSKIAKWDKKKITIWDKNVLIFEAILDEKIEANHHALQDTLTLEQNDTIELHQVKEELINIPEPKILASDLENSSVSLISNLSSTTTESNNHTEKTLNQFENKD